MLLWLCVGLGQWAAAVATAMVMASTAQAQITPAWEVVAPPSLTAAAARDTRVAVSKAGVPYVAYSDAGEGGRATVMRLNSAGTGWEPVGLPGFSAGAVGYVSLAISPEGTLFVSYSDVSLDFKAVVMEFSASTGRWHTLGEVGLGSGETFEPTLALDPSGVPFIALSDPGNDYQVSVMRFNRLTGAWEAAGPAGFAKTVASKVALAIDSQGRPYVVFPDINHTFKATAMRLNEAGTSWDVMGEAGFTEGMPLEHSLVFDPQGQLYLAFSNADPGREARVMRWHEASQQWDMLAADDLTSFASDIGLATDSEGGLYLAFTDGTHESKPTVMHYNTSNQHWELVGPAGFSAQAAWYTSLAIDGQGTPYVAFTDLVQRNKTTVMRWSHQDEQWTVVGGADFLMGEADYPSIAFDSKSKPYVAYQDLSNSNKATVIQLNSTGDAWVPLGVAGFTDGPVSHVSLAVRFDDVPYVPYVAFLDEQQLGVTVMRYNRISDRWETVGSPSFSDNWAVDITLVFNPDGVPYVAFRDYANNAKATVMRYVEARNTWENVGAVGFSNESVENVVMAIDSQGVPYVGYTESSVHFVATVKRFDAASQRWESVGVERGVSPPGTYRLNLAHDSNDVLYVSYTDTTDNARVQVLRFDKQSEQWLNVGGGGMSEPRSHGPHLVMSAADVPTVVYMDEVHDFKATVQRLNGASNHWERLGERGISAGVAYRASLAYSPAGQLYLVFYDGARGGIATVMRWSEIPPTVPGAPTKVQAVASTNTSSGSGSAQLSFDAPEYTGGAGVVITGYTVTSEPAGASCPVSINPDGPQQSCFATGLQDGVSYTFSVYASNAVGAGPAVQSNAVVLWPALVLSGPGELLGAQVGQAYRLPLQASGGSGGYQFGLAEPSQALPAGLALDRDTGLVSGTPTQAGDYELVFQVVDSAGSLAEWPWTMVVAAANVSVPPEFQALPDGWVGSAYSAAIVAMGGTGEYRYSLESGQLPEGLSLDGQSGMITGTPTREETQAFSILIASSAAQASASQAATARNLRQDFSITVRDAAALPAGVKPVPSLSAMGLLALNGLAALWVAFGWVGRVRRAPR